MSSAGANDEQLAKAKKFCFSLRSEDRTVRKQALIDFEKFISDQNDFTSEDYHKIFVETHIYFVNGLRDKSEPVREQAIKFASTFIIDVLPKNDFYLSYVFPMLLERLGTCELVEESEEIRLQLVGLLECILTKYYQTEQLKSFLNDIVSILKETVQDKYPAVKEKSCHCIIKLAHALPGDFHMRAECLVKPVLTNFSHQRYKIRCEAIKCIGEIVLNSNHKGLDEVVGPMAERLFDQIPAVRTTVAHVASRWLLEYRDRYSYFHKLLPLILTGLNDEVPETRDVAHRLWDAIGLQYQKENENELKDQLDYLTAPPKYYLKHLKRANLGCRVLVQRNVSKLAKPLSRELTSWQGDVRIRCSQLLCAVVLLAEDGITHNLQDLLPAMYAAARDENKAVVDNIIRAGEMVGLFVCVGTWKKLILPAIEDGPHFGHLCVLSALIRGAPQENVSPHLQEISSILAAGYICQSQKRKYQQELIDCVTAMMQKLGDSGTSDTGRHLFAIIVTVVSLRDAENLHLTVDLLDDLREYLKLESRRELWNRYLGDLLNTIREDPKSWSAVTPECRIFKTVLTASDEAFGENLTAIGEILVDALDSTADAESRLKIFIALSEAFDRKDVTFKNAKDPTRSTFLETLVVEVFVPSLVWHAGRTAEVMRTMAASCLFSALNGTTMFTSADVLRPLFDRLVPLLLSLADDASSASRRLALQDLVSLKRTAVTRNVWQLDDLLKVYPEVAKRLDDPTDKVRICAVESLAAVLQDPPEDFLKANFKWHHEYVVDTLLVHFDDDDGQFQELIKGVLKVIAKLYGEVLLGRLTTHRSLLRNREGCDEIIDYVKSLSL